MKKLDDPQKEILEFITAYSRENAYPPSVREICEAVGLKSTATVHTHLKNMEAKGLILRDSNKQRAIIVAPGALSGQSGCVKLIGRVAAGQPILADENVEDAFPLPPILMHGSDTNDTFMLHVEGDSMIDAGIRSGDIIIVDRSISYEDGDIVVVRTQQESATVKRIYREKDHVRLQPENPLYEPILLPYSDVVVVGRVIGLMRSMK